MSSTATEKWEQTALEQLVRSPGRGGHAPGEGGRGQVGRKGWVGLQLLVAVTITQSQKMPHPDVLKGEGKQVYGHAKERGKERERA